MSITPTYPGVYVEELASATHSVTAAPTSVTAFVGYSHPLKTTTFNQAIQLGSFADYQASFGGFFSHPLLPDYLGQAVYQFFNNGGSTAWVVGLPSKYYSVPAGAGASPTEQGAVVGATLTLGTQATGEIVFTALEPTALNSDGPGIPMSLTLTNLRQTSAANDTADLTFAYGTTVETYRRVTVGNVSTALSGSALVTVAVNGSPQSYPGVTPGQPNSFGYSTAVNAAWTVISPQDFSAAFDSGSSLDKVEIFNLLALPGIAGTAAYSVLADAMAFCERKLAFLIMDAPSYAVADTTESTDPTATALATAAGLLVTTPPATTDTIDDMLNGGSFFPASANCAVYFPWVQTTDPITGQPSQTPPSGFVAGMFAQEDSAVGVWKSPAGLETVLQTPGVVQWGRMTDARQGVLNPLGINCLRQFTGIGTVIFGASTLVRNNPAYQQYWYVSVRRMALFIEQSLSSSLRWAVFAPNDQQLWTALRMEVQAFMLSLFLQGAFPGSTPDQAFQVQCDATTTTSQDIASGTANIVVSFAPLKPAEFVVIKIAQLAGQS
jgi:uncharacterized protein